MLLPPFLRFISLITLCSLTLTACYNNENNQHENASTGANGIAEELIEINVSASGELSEDDLSLFAKKLEGARIVGLGEQTHGAGSVFKLKVQLIKYLHKNHGYDLFILESGMYDVKKIWQEVKKGRRLKSLARNNIFYMYANSNEVTPLFDYIDQQANSSSPLVLVGFDSQHTGSYSNDNLLDDLQFAVQKLPEQWHEDASWAIFKENLQQVLNVSTKRLPIKQEQDFFNELSSIEQSFLKQSQLNTSTNVIDNNGFWYRITRGLAAQAKRQWKISDSRSQEMGENIKWWAEQYPNKKIMVWAHTWHLTKEGSNQINAGKVVSDNFGKDYYMIHFTGASGEYLDFINLKNRAVAVPNENAIEKIVENNSTANIEFLHVSDIKTNNYESQVFSYDYQETINAEQWFKYWDGIFVIKQIEPATYQTQ